MRCDDAVIHPLCVDSVGFGIGGSTGPKMNGGKEGGSRERVKHEEALVFIKI